MRTALLAATTALLALLSAGLWFVGLRVHQWILVVDLGLVVALAAATGWCGSG